MSRLGMNIHQAGTVPRTFLLDLGIRTVRLVPRRQYDLRRYLGRLTDRGISVLFVYDSDALSDFGPVDNDAPFETIDETAREAFGFYQDRYGYLNPMHQVCNEPSGHGPASWKMSWERNNEWLLLGRRYLGDNSYLVAGGLDDGYPPNLHHINLDWVQACAVHPYGRWPDQDMMPPWYFGYATELLAEYRRVLNDELGRTDKHLHVTEWGAPVWDFTPGLERQHRLPDTPAMVAAYRRDQVEQIKRWRQVGHVLRERANWDAHGAYYSAMCETFLNTDIVGDAYIFSARGMVDPFDVAEPNGHLRPAGEAIRWASQTYAAARRAA